MKNTVFVLFGLLTLGLFIIFSGCVTEDKIIVDNNVNLDTLNQVVKGNNEFAFNLYDILPNNENQFFSPYSIDAAFAILGEASKDNTKKELDYVFGYSDSLEKRIAFAKLYYEINKDSSEYKLSTANAIWANNNFPLLSDYVNNVQKYYGAKLDNLDFSKSDNATKVVNEWVADNTNNKIQNILQPGFINQDTRIIIANAIYFKGKWVNAFKESNTEEKEFTKDNNEIVNVDMMQMYEEDFAYYENNNLQAIKLPYKGDKLSMLVLLPKDNLESLTIDNNKYNFILDNLSYQSVDLFLPKFKLEVTYNKLKSQLESLGLKEVFTENADLSGFTGERNLFVSDVIHKAFVEVKEEGTEAAAATVIGIKTTAMPIEDDKPKVFNANHPFMFIIMDNTTREILFIGSIASPLQ